jgi:hypothetical protein
MPSLQKNARIAGVFYLVTFITSIPAVFLLDPVLKNSNFITGSGSTTNILLGCMLDVANAIACIGTAVAIFPLVVKENKSLAIGFVTSRVFEAAVIMIGVVSLLAVVSLRENNSGNTGVDGGTLQLVGEGFVELRNWTFLLGPGMVPAINGLLLGLLLYRSQLVPRIIPIMGLIGAPLLFASAMGTVFGVVDQVSPIAAVLGLPIALWELSLGIWLVAKGVRSAQLERL